MWWSSTRRPCSASSRQCAAGRHLVGTLGWWGHQGWCLKRGRGAILGRVEIKFFGRAESTQGGSVLEGSRRVSREKECFGEGTLKQAQYEMFPLPRLPQLSAAIALVGGISQQLQERKAEALAQISAAFEDLEQALQQRKQALVSDLEAICGAKQKVRRLTLPTTGSIMTWPYCLHASSAFHTSTPLSLVYAFCLLTWPHRCCGHLCPLSTFTLLYFFHAIVLQVHQESETPLSASLLTQPSPILSLGVADPARHTASGSGTHRQ